MELNDRKIRQLIGNLREHPAESLSPDLEELKRETGMYIYSFPAMAYRKDRDTCSEFYLFVLERLEKVLASFPLGAEVRFKTWFNYVLRNQFHNFSFYGNRQKISCVSLDGREDECFIELFEQEEFDFNDLRKCLDGLGAWDRILIKFHYLPESLDSPEIRQTALATGLTVREVLDIRKGLVMAHREDVQRKRDLASKIGVINRRLTGWKYRLKPLRFETGDAAFGELNALMAKIARAETARSRMVRELRSPDRKAFKQFSRLFKNRAMAGRRLDLARSKLRFGMMTLAKQKDGVA